MTAEPGRRGERAGKLEELLGMESGVSALL